VSLLTGGLKTSRAAQIAAVLIAALLVSARSLGHEFVFDDHMLVGGNAPVLRGEAPLLSTFTYRYWGAADEAAPNELYRPVTILSLAVNARLLGSGPAGMHAGNIALHCLNSLLVLLLLGALFGRPRLAFGAALIFAVHPIASEAVVPVAGRADLLAGTCLLLACALGLAAARRRGTWIFIGGLGVAFLTFFGALAKEHAFVAPLLMVALLGADRRRHEGDPLARRDYRLTAATLAGLQVFVLLMVLLLRVHILGYLFHTGVPENASTSYLAFVNNPVQFAEPLPRVLTALRVAVMGAGRLILPWQLSADYSYDVIPVTALPPGIADLGAVAFALLYLGLVAWSARRYPIVMFALSWSALTYLLASNLLFPIGTIFGERLLYLPSVGFALLISAGLERLAAGGDSRRRAAAALLAAATLIYGARFIGRAGDWQNDARLFEATVMSSPRSAKAHSNQGFVLQRAGRYEEAAAAFGEALRIAPGLTGAGVSRARCLMELGRPAEAVTQYEQVMARDDGISVAWSGLGMAQLALERMDQAEGSFRKSLGLSMGGNREAVRGLGETLARTGREEAAVALLEKASGAVPGDAGLRRALGQAHTLLGVRRLKEGEREAFLTEMKRTVEIDPGNGQAHFNLALDAMQRGQNDDARDHARAARGAGYTFPPGFLEALGLGQDAGGAAVQEPGPPGS
jgi:protein O-mannosyl-transferase